ncbi:hypothetical protein ACH4S9_13270 [Streptomyces sp. NPDC021225]|uniref:hypothetical protein n=1 Tax=Streptomyces sp. NPDC021225 TaxID=3365121 RepID=UPI0037B6746B
MDEISGKGRVPGLLVQIVVEEVLGHGLRRLGPVCGAVTDDHECRVLAVGAGHRQRARADVDGQVVERPRHLEPGAARPGMSGRRPSQRSDSGTWSNRLEAGVARASVMRQKP